MQRSCPALPVATAVKILLWNLWMTLETGQWNLKTDFGPKVIVSCPSHPFSPTRTQLFHTRHMTTVCGERARYRGQGSVEEVWEIPGRDEEQFKVSVSY